MAAPTKPSRAPGNTPSRAANGKSPEMLSADAPPASNMLAGVTGVRRVPTPVNEPIKSYAPGSPERTDLKARLDSMASERIDIPVIIGGKEIRTGQTSQAVMPHNHKHVLADWHRGGAEHARMAIEAARVARREWANWAWEDRAAVFLKAAELL